MQQKQTALITGASGGIGYELSKLFAADGYNLILVARSTDKLDKLAAELTQAHGINVVVLSKDLSDPKAPTDIFEAVEARKLQVDVLVNNAGFGIQKPFAGADMVETLQMIQLNVITLTMLTRLFLPGMLARKSGRILNIGSTGSFAPVPSMAAYGATKAYVLSFSEALAEELRGSGVTVTALCPGVTYTGFQERSGMFKVGLLRLGGMSAVDVARIGHQAVKRGRVVAVTGLFNQLMTFSMRFAPRPLVRRLSRQMMEG
ncbi:MAG: SDR family oxidoreductase [Anaerolineae bacterium]|nr:SDR family oxidoreductase [Anaerolineae bacterium]